MKATETTQRLLLALNGVNALDLSQLFGSCVTIELGNFTTGSTLTGGHVAIPAEHMGPVLDALRGALVKSMASRRQWILQDVAAIDAAIDAATQKAAA